MELEKTVERHTELLQEHSDQIKSITLEMNLMQREIHDGLTRVDESNKFLREQNTRQSEQNTQILNAILDQKDEAQKRDHDFKMMNRGNIWKLILLIGGTSSIITYLIDKVWNLI